MSQQALNDPPRMPPFPRPGGEQAPPTVDEVATALGKAASNDPPTMEPVAVTTVDLPAGWITPMGRLIQTARVRELNGFDEEKLSRLDSAKNVAVYVTELLWLGVEDLGGEKPTKDILRNLLIGDRDALVLGIRQATYGNNVEFKLHCPICDSDSEAYVELDKDIPIIKPEDPLLREFDVPLKNGTAKVVLLNGFAQEAFSENILNKKQTEINTAMLSKSVVEINGMAISGEDSRDAVRALSSGDRQTLVDFMGQHNIGPQFNEGVEVPCATCGEEYPVSLGLPNLFRF